MNQIYIARFDKTMFLVEAMSVEFNFKTGMGKIIGGQYDGKIVPLCCGACDITAYDKKDWRGYKIIRKEEYEKLFM